MCTHQFSQGDAVVFGNPRMLHGRTTFEDGLVNGDEANDEPNRWLKGCYFEDDALASHGRRVPRARMVHSEI